MLTGFARNPIGSVAEFEDAASEYAEAGFTDFVVHWPREGDPFPGNRAVFERIVADVVAPAAVAGSAR